MRYEDGERRESTDVRRPFGGEKVGDGGSYPTCSIPKIHIVSVQLSGVASLSRIKRIALSFPCLAAASKADVPLLLDGDATELRCCWEIREGRERSAEEVLKVCENQPESLLGRSEMREVEDDG